MISRETRTINQLIATIYKDKSDPTVIRVDIDRALHILSENNILVVSQDYTSRLNTVFSKKVEGKAQIKNSTVYAMAKLMYDLAVRMQVDESDIFIHTLLKEAEHNSAVTQQTVDEWRREFYGKLSKEERMALADRLEDKLRPEVINKIRYPK